MAKGKIPTWEEFTPDQPPKADSAPSWENFQPDVVNRELATEEGLPQEEPEIPILEAIARGAGRGMSAEFLDELRGAVAAGAGTLAEKFYEKPVEEKDILKTLSPKVQKQVQKSPELKQQLKGLEEEKETTFDKFKRLYDEYRGAERARSELAEEQHPTTTLLSQIAGGVAIPAGTVGKGVGLAKKALIGSAVGGAYGGLTGAGAAKTTEEIVPEAITGGVAGAAFGAALPALGAGFSKLAQIKALNDFNKSYNLIKKMPEITLIGQKGEEQAAALIKPVTETISDTLKSFRTQTNQIKNVILDKSTDEGMRLNLTDKLMSAKKDLTNVIKSKYFNQSAIDDAEEVIKTIDDILKGPITSAGYKPVKPILETPEEIATKKLQKLKDKLYEAKDIPQTKEDIIRKSAEISRKTENKLINLEPQIDEALVQMQLSPEDFSNVGEKSEFIHKMLLDSPKETKKILREVGITSKLPRMPEFSAPEEFIDLKTGKKLVESVGATTGMSIIKSAPEKSLAGFKKIIKPGDKEFLQFKDLQSNKVYEMPIETGLASEVAPVYGRSGDGAGALTPNKLNEIRQTIQTEYTPKVRMDKGKAPLTSDVGKIATDLVNDMKLNLEDVAEGYSDANRAYSNIAQVFDQLGLSDDPAIEDIMKSLGGRIMKLQDDSKPGYLHREITKSILEKLKVAEEYAAKAANPKLKPEEIKTPIYEQVNEQMENLATRLDLAFKGGEPVVRGTSKPSLTVAESLRGVPIALGEYSARTINTLSNMSPGKLAELATKSIGMNTDVSKAIGNALSKASQIPQKNKRQALMFGMIQQPAYREFIQNFLPELGKEEE